MEGEAFCLAQTEYRYQDNGTNKAGFQRQRPAVVIVRIGRKFDLAYYIWYTIGVDLNDPVSENKISDALGCDGALHLHLTNRKFRMRYLVGPQNLVPTVAKIRHGISKKNKTTCANTRLDHNVFFKENTNRQIAPNELGGPSLKHFLEYTARCQMAPRLIIVKN